jgi:hypothetical protein
VTGALSPFFPVINYNTLPDIPGLPLSVSRRYFRFDCAYSVQELALASLFPVDRQGLPPGQTANVTFDRLYLKVGGWQGALVMSHVMQATNGTRRE